jgi:hypothetical protein
MTPGARGLFLDDARKESRAREPGDGREHEK